MCKNGARFQTNLYYAAYERNYRRCSVGDAAVLRGATPRHAPDPTSTPLSKPGHPRKSTVMYYEPANYDSSSSPKVHWETSQVDFSRTPRGGKNVDSPRRSSFDQARSPAKAVRTSPVPSLQRSPLKLIPVILSGGARHQSWPASREAEPAVIPTIRTIKSRC